MAGIRGRRAAIGGLLWLALWSVAACGGESDQLFATIQKPAVITVPRPQFAIAGKSASAGTSVTLNVTDYRPAKDGSSVEVVVTARVADSHEVEIGRVGITPDRAFDANDKMAVQRFRFNLPREMAGDQPVTFGVRLNPVQGDGKGAMLRVSHVEIK